MIRVEFLVQKLFTAKHGRIVHSSVFNNENNKNEKQNSLKSKMKDVIFNSTIVKADIF